MTSGCSIVAEALFLDERAIEVVWEKRSRFGIADRPVSMGGIGAV